MVSQNICLYNKFGHCKCSEECRMFHVNEMCDNPNCDFKMVLNVAIIDTMDGNVVTYVVKKLIIFKNCEGPGKLNHLLDSFSLIQEKILR